MSIHSQSGSYISLDMKELASLTPSEMFQNAPTEAAVSWAIFTGPNAL
jgi:hypothetical protein